MDEEISNKKKYMSSFWKVYLINILWEKYFKRYIPIDGYIQS